MKLVREGMKGPEVESIQKKLNIKITGVFDAATKESVKAFQRIHGLDDDGVVGDKTRAKLFPQPESNSKIPAVHLSKKGVLRTQESTRAFPLSESDMPFSDGTPEAIHRIVEFLNVEKSLRYKRTPKSTFCNIYAFDFAYLMRAYFPRVWWFDRAIETANFECKYGTTVGELNANSLWEWFPEFGDQFGWKELENVSMAQKHANAGECVIMVAANKDRKKSGHIVVVVPESDRMMGVGSGGIYIYPAQSQAGATNKKYFSSKWWNGLESLRIYACKVGSNE
jgi:peptidoglycan hydrolase-like protein with peptidoglycan-binding domain